MVKAHTTAHSGPFAPVDAEPRSQPGRPAVTTHARIEQVAFEMFDRHGFRQTTVGAIAEQVGIGKRTLFRYFDSKNDIPWGRFDESLEQFRTILAQMPHDLELHVAVHRGVLLFNDFDDDVLAQHRRRMELILGTPELQAHSVLRFADWRAVIADYVANRTGQKSSDVMPQVAGRVSLALALAAYDAWLLDPHSSLRELLASSLSQLRFYLSVGGQAAR